MTQPLALVVYEELKPGSQLINRLQDLHYRVQPVSDARQLAENPQIGGTMLIFLDWAIKTIPAATVIASLKANSATAHIPIIVFVDEGSEGALTAAKQAGANQVVTDTAVLAHLPELIQQALQIE